MILQLAWRNIWRNPTRSFVVIGAVAIGIWAAIFMSGFATGMVKSYISNAIENVVSHIQIHHPEFSKDYDVKYFLSAPDDLKQIVDQTAHVEVTSFRTLVNGMLSSAKGSRGIRVKAVEPEAEAKVSHLDQKIIEGEYFGGDRKNELLIGKAMAEKLKVKLRSKVVLTFQDLNGDITAAAFRIVGVFQTGNKPFDEAHVFVQLKDMNRLLLPAVSPESDSSVIQSPLPERVVHEVAIMLDDAQNADTVSANLASVFPKLKVETYRDVSPDLRMYESQMKSVSLIYLFVIMLALIFGIVNTMMMAVLERIRELGMLMAIGMNKTKVFFMIVLEAFMLGMVAVPIGLLLGYFTIAYLGVNGIDLSSYSETMQMYGMSEVVYFDLEPIVYWQVPISVGLTAVLASIYPALKAIRLRPVEAIRKI